MELVDYLRMLRRQWVWVVGSVVVLTALAVVYVMTTPKTYKATAEVFVGSNVIGTSAPDNSAALSASNYVFDRIDTYATWADYPAVLQPVVTTLKLGTTADDLSKQVSASVVPSTVIIAVSATDASAQQAADIANATANSLVKYIAATDTPVANSTSPVKAQVSSVATKSGAPDSPNRNLMIALGVLVGLALGLVLASLRDQLRRTSPARKPAPATSDGPEPVEVAAKAPAKAARTSGEQGRRPGPEPTADHGSAPTPKADEPEAPTASLEAALASTQAREAARKASRPASRPVEVPPADRDSATTDA